MTRTGRPRESANGEAKAKVSFRLPTDVIAIIRKQANQALYIEAAVREKARRDG